MALSNELDEGPCAGVTAHNGIQIWTHDAEVRGLVPSWQYRAVSGSTPAEEGKFSLFEYAFVEEYRKPYISPGLIEYVSVEKERKPYIGVALLSNGWLNEGPVPCKSVSCGW